MSSDLARSRLVQAAKRLQHVTGVASWIGKLLKCAPFQGPENRVGGVLDNGVMHVYLDRSPSALGLL